MHLIGSLAIECDDEGPVLWIRNRRDGDAVSIDLTPRNIEQLEAACAEARKYHALPVIQKAARDEAERLGERP